MFNTPPTYAWYVAGLVFEWLKGQGGLRGDRAQRNERKAQKLYRAIDASNFYSGRSSNADRSSMNVPFTLSDAGARRRFLEGRGSAPAC